MSITDRTIKDYCYGWADIDAKITIPEQFLNVQERGV